MTLTVAVTGATGFIGKHIVSELLSHGCRVRALTRSQRQTTDERLSWIRGALEDQQALNELVSGADCVIHCAGQVRGSTEAVFTDCNVNGSVAVMKAARAAGNCKKFLFISSLAARHPELSWYAKSKNTAEQQLKTLCGGMTLGIFRPTAVYGPGDKELRPVFNGLLRGILLRPGNHDTLLTFVHVADLAVAARAWLLGEDTSAGTFELCDGNPGGYRWSRLQQTGAAVRNGPVYVVSVPMPVLKFAAGIIGVWSRLTHTEPMLTQNKIREIIHPDWSASNQQLTEAAGWVPEVSLERALRERLF